MLPADVRADVVVFPRLQRRGPIEAESQRPDRPKRRGFRAFNGAAPLKRAEWACFSATALSFRAFNGAAPLKLAALDSVRVNRRLFPRLQRRGPIEAVSPIVSASPIARCFRAFNGAAPLKPPMGEYPGGNVSQFPRLQRRGPIEARRRRRAP